MNHVTPRPMLQDIVKSAMAAAAERVSVSTEARLQAEKTAGEEECKGCKKAMTKCACQKTAAAAPSTSKLASEDHVEKLAGALDFLASEFRKEATSAAAAPPPGVSATQADGTMSDNSGQARHQPPSGGTQAAHPGEAATQNKNDMSSPPGGSAKAPVKNASIDVAEAVKSKLAASEEALEKKETEGMHQAEKGLDKAQAAHNKEKKAEEGELSTKEKLLAFGLGGPGGYFGAKRARGAGESALEGGVRGATGLGLGGLVGGTAGRVLAEKLAPDNVGALLAGGVGGQLLGGLGGYHAAMHGIPKEAALADYFLAKTKQAAEVEHGGMDASVRAGGAVAPQTSAAGQPGGTPAGGAPKGPTGLVSSNQAAINYKRRDAYANRKDDVGQYVSERALSSATDPVLNNAFKHTGEAGPKVASAEGTAPAPNESREVVETSTKTAAAKVLLAKLSEAADADKTNSAA